MASSMTEETRDESHDTQGTLVSQSGSTSSSSTQRSLPCTPPQYDSEYRWCSTESKGRTIWYRNIDGMANFILHWQNRFHNHGDMYAQGILQQQSQRAQPRPIEISREHLREALRRLRTVHPYIAVEGRSKAELNAQITPLPRTLRHLNNLQIVLAYTVPRSDADVDEWLDEVIQVHSNEESSRDFATFFRSVSLVERDSISGLRVHLWEADLENGEPARIVLEQSHVVSDGGGLLLMMDELLSFLSMTLANPKRATITTWGQEVTRLPPSLQDAIASPPESWQVTKKELKKIERDNRARMSGKATPPNVIDKVVDRIMEVTLANNASESKIRRGLNRPLARIVRAVAETGAMFPLGLLPNATKPFKGPWTHSDYFEDMLTKSETSRLLAGLKRHKITLAPFMEAAMAFATTWVRRQRGLTPKRGAWDPSTKVIGSFSNAVNKRDQLESNHQRYLGLAMGGIATKISAGKAVWSEASVQSAVPSPLDETDQIPSRVEEEDLANIVDAARILAEQYRMGRQDSNWLKYDKATMFGAMQAEYMCLSDEAYYPSHPWLSSPGRLDAMVTAVRPIPSPNLNLDDSSFDPTQFDSCKPTLTQLSDHASGDSSLVVSNVRLIGRANLAQAICHLYSFNGEMIITVSYPDWLYHDGKGDNKEGESNRNNGRRLKRHGVDYAKKRNILPLWYSVVRLILQSLIDEA